MNHFFVETMIRERLRFPANDPKWPVLPEVSRMISQYYDRLAWADVLGSVDDQMWAVLRSDEQIVVLREVYLTIKLGLETHGRRLRPSGGILATKMIRSAHHSLYYFFEELVWGANDGVSYALTGAPNWDHIKYDREMGSPLGLMRKLEAIRTLYLRLFRLWAGDLKIWGKLSCAASG